MKFFEALPPCLVGLEACATANGRIRLRPCVLRTASGDEDVDALGGWLQCAPAIRASRFVFVLLPLHGSFVSNGPHHSPHNFPLIF
jgi:hypothetical protein